MYLCSFLPSNSTKTPSIQQEKTITSQVVSHWLRRRNFFQIFSKITLLKYHILLIGYIPFHFDYRNEQMCSASQMKQLKTGTPAKLKWRSPMRYLGQDPCEGKLLWLPSFHGTKIPLTNIPAVSVVTKNVVSIFRP